MTFTVADVRIEIRHLLGGLSTTVMDDPTMDLIIQREVDKLSLEDEDECLVTYNSLLAVLQYLINAQAADSAGGKVLEREEKNGKRSAKIKFSKDGDSGWQDLYDKFLRSPELVCESLSNVSTTIGGVVSIGGTSEEEYARVNGRGDSRNGYQTSVRQAYNRVTARSIRRRRRTLR